MVWAMMGHDDPLAVEVLIGLSSDPAAENRDWACFALGSMIELDTPRLREALAARLDDEDDGACCEATVGLAQRGDLRVVPHLARALAAGSVCILEVEAASLIGDPSLHAKLVDLRGRWRVDEGLLEEAILACSPRPSI